MGPGELRLAHHGITGNEDIDNSTIIKHETTRRRGAGEDAPRETDASRDRLAGVSRLPTRFGEARRSFDPAP